VLSPQQTMAEMQLLIFPGKGMLQSNTMLVCFPFIFFNFSLCMGHPMVKYLLSTELNQNMGKK